MTAPTPEQVQALAEELEQRGFFAWLLSNGGSPLWGTRTPEQEIARVILASDWFAAHIAAERAEAARQALAPVLAERDAWRAAVAEVVRDHDMPPRKDSHGYDYRMGWWDAVTHADRLIRYRVRAAAGGGEDA